MPRNVTGENLNLANLGYKGRILGSMYNDLPCDSRRDSFLPFPDPSTPDQTRANAPKTALPPVTEPEQGSALSKRLKVEGGAAVTDNGAGRNELAKSAGENGGGRDCAFDSSFRRRRPGEPIPARNCAHCGVSFTPERLKTTGKNRNLYCSRRCAAKAPRPGTHFRTPESTKAERVRANGLVNMRLRLGHFTKPDACTRCGAKKRLDAHHPDYSEPDLVAFLCRSCHVLAHNRPEVEAEVAQLVRRAAKGGGE